MILFVLEYGSAAKIIGLIIFLLNAISVSQAYFFFLRLICVSDRNGLPFSVLYFVSSDPTPESVGQVGRVVGQFGGTVGRCELAVGGLEVCDVAWFPVRRRKRSRGPTPSPLQVLRPVWGRVATGGRPESDSRAYYPEQEIISPEVLLTLRGNVHPGSHPLLLTALSPLLHHTSRSY